jgi:hypothetical protein
MWESMKEGVTSKEECVNCEIERDILTTVTDLRIPGLLIPDSLIDLLTISWLSTP